MAVAGVASAEPLRLHPQNPHYFLFRGKPTVLVTSGEHYGAVINLDFKYDIYLDALAADGLNLTRLFVGSYLEKPGDFGIRYNTLAPAPGRAITPWARSSTDGFAGGGPKFDLDRWDPAYFARLKDFVAKADARGIVVEVVMFSNWYGKGTMSPLHPSNNVNGLAPSRPGRRAHARQRRAARAPGSDGAQGRRGAQRVRQRLLRDPERARRHQSRDARDPGGRATRRGRHG